jgi:hypothetical protein
MLCEGHGADRPVVGLLQGILPTGHLTLSIPGAVTPTRITWRSVVIEPLSTVHISSSERVVFLRIPHERYHYDI